VPRYLRQPGPCRREPVRYVIDSQNVNVLANSATLWVGSARLADGGDTNAFYNFVESAAAGNKTFRYVWAYRAP
jgi:hypothetical protein